jgi:hypothetical protein
MDALKQFIFAQATGCPAGSICINTLPDPTTDAGRLTVILNFVFGLTGAIAVLVITVAGFRYVLSHGDPNLIAQSKNAIIYALVGLIVSIFSLAIVNFVIGRVG